MRYESRRLTECAVVKLIDTPRVESTNPTDAIIEHGDDIGGGVVLTDELMRRQGFSPVAQELQ